jgi:hypothetical protein
LPCELSRDSATSKQKASGHLNPRRLGRDSEIQGLLISCLAGIGRIRADTRASGISGPASGRLDSAHGSGPHAPVPRALTSAKSPHFESDGHAARTASVRLGVTTARGRAGSGSIDQLGQSIAVMGFLNQICLSKNKHCTVTALRLATEDHWYQLGHSPQLDARGDWHHTSCWEVAGCWYKTRILGGPHPPGGSGSFNARPPAVFFRSNWARSRPLWASGDIWSGFSPS